jgi:hypothetical protein
MANALKAHETSAKKFLMLGDTGSGKTSQFLTLPGKKFMYLFDSNAILSLQGHDVDYEEFLPDRLNLSVKSLKKDVGDKTTNFKNDLFVAWEKDFNEKLDAGFFNEYNVIGMDSATTFLDLIMDRVLTINGRAGNWPQQDDYGPQMLVFTNVSRTLTSLGKIIYFTGHMETKQDEVTKRIFRKPMLTGRLTTKIPLLFSDIFICEVENDGRGNITHKLQTAPDRMTTTVRTSFKGLAPFEDVSLDFKKPLGDQGLGKLMRLEREGKL